MKLPTKSDEKAGRDKAILEQDLVPAPSEVLDILHLEHQVLDDTELRDELLRLYADRLTALAPLVCGPPGRDRSEAAHTLKGASLAVGAFALARLCAALEGEDEGSEAGRYEAALVIEGTRRRVAELLHSSD
jgi:HPt (histidine-containing phosphotransfer) domain-containing protein